MFLKKARLLTTTRWYENKRKGVRKWLCVCDSKRKVPTVGHLGEGHALDHVSFQLYLVIAKAAAKQTINDTHGQCQSSRGTPTEEEEVKNGCRQVSMLGKLPRKAWDAGMRRVSFFLLRKRFLFNCIRPIC